MNHIKFYESIINDYANGSPDLRIMMRQFYQMPLKQANEIVEQIKIMLDMKIDDFTKCD